MQSTQRGGRRALELRSMKRHKEPFSFRRLTAALALLMCAALSAFPVAASGGAGGLKLPEASGAAGSGAAEAPADDPGASGASPRMTVKVVPQRDWASPGGDLVLAVILDHQAHWHSWPAAEQDVLPANVAEFAIRTRIEAGSKTDTWIGAVGATQYPVPVPSKVSDPTGEHPTITVPTYEGRAVAYIPLLISPEAPVGRHDVTVTVRSQSCNERVCEMPQDAEVTVTVEVVPLAKAATMPGAGADTDKLFAGFEAQRLVDLRAGKGVATASGGGGAASLIQFDVFGLGFSIDPRGAGLALLLLVAFIGGILLNLTPCVLPVIPLKIMGLANSAKNPRHCLYLGAVMSAGVVAFWLALGLMILTISGFTAISSLFSYPAVILGIGVFIVAMSLGMFGLFTVSLPQSVYMLNPRSETTPGAFVFGMLTAVLSTPCTAPLMGTAAAWAAATHNPALVLSVFGAIGVGMALPYLILAASPRLLSKVPSSGPASELVKQVMGGLMIAVAIFFLCTGTIGLVPGWKWLPPVMWWSIAVAVAATAVWMVACAFGISRSFVRRGVVAVLGVILTLVPTVLAINMTRKDPIPWQEYDAAALQASIAKGDVVVLDFTAEWCLNCKALEQTVLRTSDLVKVLNSSGVVPMKADVTPKTAPGWAKLKELGEVGIPLLAVLHGGDGPDGVVFKSNAYTPQQVIAAIEKARPTVVGAKTP